MFRLPGFLKSLWPELVRSLGALSFSNVGSNLGDFERRLAVTDRVDGSAALCQEVRRQAAIGSEIAAGGKPILRFSEGEQSRRGAGFAALVS